MVVWRGTSALDNVSPIVVLATYDTRDGDHSSANVKTGGMMQLYILRDDTHPMDTLQTGADTAICGSCPHMSKSAGGSGACYVQVFRAPSGIWKAYKRDGLRTDRDGNPTSVGDSLPYDVTAFVGRKVRFGAYGDPAAVPAHVWSEIAEASGHRITGYTHAWRTCDPQFAKWCMASCDSMEDYAAARRKGYRAFLVRALGSDKPKGLVVCPASVEAGKRTVCADCLQCGGTSSGRTASITIMAHGASAKKFQPLPLSIA